MVYPKRRLLSDSHETVQASLDDGDRLMELAGTRLLDSLSDTSFDRYTELAALSVNAPVSLITLLDSDRQYLKSNLGLSAQPFCDARQTPMSHSVCQYVVHTEEPLIIPDTSKADFLNNNLAPSELSVKAYIGYPIYINGKTLGSFCVIDTVPREWTDREVTIAKHIAEAVNIDIECRNASFALNLSVQQLNGLRNELSSSLRTQMKDRALALSKNATSLMEESKAVAKLSMYDPVTNCYEALYLPYAIEKASGSGLSCAIIEISFDHFEQIFGKLDTSIKDRYLNGCIKLIKSCLNLTGVIVRTDHSKFAIVLQDITLTRCIELAELICETIGSFHFHDSKQDFTTTLSLGVAKFGAGAKFDDLTSSVDAACRAAADKGGNRVKVATAE